MSNQESQTLNNDPFRILAGGGEMGSLIRTHNWNNTSLGDITQWPPSLLTSVSLMLNSRFPMFIFWGPEYIALYNDAYTPSLGANKHPAALGARVRDIWPESWDTIKALVDKAFAGESLYYEDLPVEVYRNGTIEEVFWTSSYSPIRDHSGAVGGCLVVCKETTQNIHNYKKLRESEKLFRFAIDATELGIWDLDPITNLLTANKRVKDWFGIPEAEDFPLEDVISKIDYKDRDRVRHAIAKAQEYEFGGTLDETYTIINPVTKTERIVRGRGLTLFDDHKKAIRFNGTLQDVTDLVRFNQKVQESEQRFRNLIVQSPIAKCLFRTSDLVIDIANNNMLSFWEKDSDVIGRPIHELEGWFVNRTVQILKSIIETGETVSLNEIRKEIPDKGISYHNLTFKPIVDSNGVIYGIMETAIDVTQLVKARQKVEESERRFRSLISQAPIAIGLFVGRDHIIESPNRAMIDIIGKGPDIIGKSLREVMPELESEGQPFLSIMDHVFDTGEVCNIYGIDIKIERNGILTQNSYDVTYSPITDIEGKVYAILEIAVDVSEKVFAQRQIAENEARFRNLVESAPFPIGVYTGKEMRILLANQAILDVWGKGNDVIGKLYTEVLPELGNQQIFEQLAEVYRTGIPYNAENARVDLVENGTLRTYYFNYNFMPLRDAYGNVYGVMNTAADVTDLNLAKQAIEATAANLRSTIVQAPVAMAILSGPEYIVEIANDKMYELWGKARTDLEGQKLFERLPEVKDQGFEELLAKVYNTGETYKDYAVPVTVPRNGGLEQIFVNLVYEAFRTSDDIITGVLAVAIDVTENVRSRLKIEQAEHKARLAIESAKLGTYEVDLSTNEVTTSERFHEIWGIDGEKPRAELSKSIHPEDLKTRERAHQQALITGILQYECRVVHPDESLHYVSINGKVVYDNEGKPKTLLGVIQDITEQKLFAEELSKQVKDRTQELFRSNEDLMRFAHVASHDLKEPVRKIKIFTNMIDEQFGDHIPQKAHVYLEKVQSATDRMYSMIEGVLAYSALSASDQPIESIDLNEVFGSIESDLEIMIQQKHAHITINELPKIEGAQVLIYQLFYNLMNNALKFSKENVPPQINVESVSNGDMATLIISDNGIGLDPNFADKIFHAFARLNAKDKYEGTGLGLALCKKIVERHHGKITATGEPGVGTTFTVNLPVRQPEKLL